MKDFIKKISGIGGSRAFLVSLCIVIGAGPFILFGHNSSTDGQISIYLSIGISMIFGIVASALSVGREHPRGRLRSIGIMLTIFLVMSSGIILLKPYIIWYLIWLVLTTFFFTLMGGYSPRMKTISYGAIIIGLYAALGYHANQPWWIEVVSLLAGAILFSTIDLIVLSILPFRALELQLADGYKELSEYFRLKSQLLVHKDPTLMRTRLAEKNVAVVSSLEKCQVLLNTYSQNVSQESLKKYTSSFVTLQNLHERAIASHANYESMYDDYQYHLVLEGFEELLYQLSRATARVSKSLINDIPYRHPVAIFWIIQSLRERVLILPEENRSTMELFLVNLTFSHDALLQIQSGKVPNSIPLLENQQLPFKQYISSLFDFDNARVRYAVRLSLGFVLAKLIAINIGLSNNDWLPLTVFFVSQTTYRGTRKRLKQRIEGTLIGVLVGGFFLMVLPTMLGKFIMLLTCIYCFFYWLKKSYSIAVIFISAFVLAVMQLLMSPQMTMIISRTISTLIGGLLVLIMTRFMWPDWQYKLLDSLSVRALDADADYFKSIFRRNKNSQDDLEYRIARRDAYLADNKIAEARASIQVEPGRHRDKLGQAIRLIYLNHALISHISALASHRNEHLPENDLIFESRKVIEAAFHIKDSNYSDSEYKDTSIEDLASLIDKLQSSIRTSRVHLSVYRLYFNIATVLSEILQ